MYSKLRNVFRIWYGVLNERKIAFCIPYGVLHERKIASVPLREAPHTSHKVQPLCAEHLACSVTPQALSAAVPHFLPEVRECSLKAQDLSRLV